MIIIGHRGAKGLAKENTLASIEAGLQSGAEVIELDVRVTKDNVVVLYHDSAVVTKRKNRLAIKNNTYKTLLKHNSKLVKLSDLLAKLNKKVMLDFDIKSLDNIEAVFKLLDDSFKSGWDMKNFYICSFDHKVLMRVRQKYPKIKIIVLERWSGARAVKRAHELNTKHICIDQKWLWKGFIEPMTRRGWILYAYTLNSKNRTKKFVKYGLHGVITDYPNIIKEIK